MGRAVKKKSKKNKFIILGVIVCIIVGILIWRNTTEDVTEEESTVTIKEVAAEKQTILNTISVSGEVSSELTENLELHATYYFEEIYFSENDYIKEGENILKYTNDTYMVAPYNLVLTSINVPSKDEQCTASHYITVQSVDSLSMELSIDESQLDKISIGQEANVNVNVNEGIAYVGYVTDISSTATYSSSGSSFKVTVCFQNDGNIKLGMSAECFVVLEKAEDVIAVPVEAVTEEKDKNYVTIVKEDGVAEQVEVETGVSNDAYIEIKSGLSGTEILQIVEEEEESNNFQNRGMNFERGGASMPEMMQGERTMPEGMQNGVR